jgi:lysophospholipase L1-like esterase
VLEGIMGDRSLMSDSIHPNDGGYAIMAENFYQAVKPYL